MLERVLIANRGEIAVRIARTCRRLGIRTVAVFSDADADALHVGAGDTAVHLPGNAPTDTYLRGDLLVDAARRSGADAVHPGYGFLAESAAFAQAVLDAGLTWIGPPPAAIAAMGSKVEAKALMRTAGVPVLADSTVADVAELEYPLLVKASAGGGGRGMRIVRAPDELQAAIAAAEREAAAAFGDGAVFVERYVRRGRHVEVQVLADHHGNIAALHERECSIQRRHQKIVEEAPSPAVSPELRRQMADTAITAARSVGYVGAGTVEFLLEPDQRFWFLEMNTRLQVEHPVTELVTGLDLVELQLAVADGERLPASALDPPLLGHAIEVRLTAEDPAADYRPSTGAYTAFELPAGVRVDTGVASGSTVSPYYDSMVAKVIAHGESRDEAIRTLSGALARARLHGPTTNRDQLLRILRHPAFRAGDLHTEFLDEHPCTEPITGDLHVAAAAVALAEQAANRATARVWHGIPSGWRNNPAVDQRITLAHGERAITVTYRVADDPFVAVEGERLDVVVIQAEPAGVIIERDGVRHTIAVAGDDARRYVDASDGHVTLTVRPRLPEPDLLGSAGSLVAPMPGAVLRVLVVPGETVVEGQPLVVVEAMKMEHQIHAPAHGRVAEVLVQPGDQVDSGQVLLRLEDEEEDG